MLSQNIFGGVAGAFRKLITIDLLMEAEKRLNEIRKEIMRTPTNSLLNVRESGT